MVSGQGFFFDRDGTLIVDSGYLHQAEGVQLLPGARQALRRARRQGELFLFSNQSGVGRGYYDWEAVEAVNRRMCSLLELGDEPFAAVCMAAERPDVPAVYRKPSPRFILETIDQFKLDPAGCWMIGDRLSDLQAGIRAGIRPVLVTNGSAVVAGSELERYLQRHRIATGTTLVECMELILER